MIKFFRKIRQRLLSENKFSKYLFYAIGEIFLVVIGILIALQINNWNQHLSDKSILASILQEILKDLKSDITILEDDIIKYENRISAVSWGLSRINYEEVPKDSLINYLITNYSDNKLSDFGFAKLQNLKNTEYYEFGELVDRIKRFYIVSGKKFNILVDWETKYSTQHIVWMQNEVESWEWTYITTADTYLSAKKEFPSMQTDEENLRRVKAMVSNMKFRNDKYDDLRRKRIMKSEYQNILKEAKEVISDIEKLIEE